MHGSNAFFDRCFKFKIVEVSIMMWINSLQIGLQLKLEEEDLKWNQRAKQHWLKLNDRNTIFFFIYKLIKGGKQTKSLRFWISMVRHSLNSIKWVTSSPHSLLSYLLLQTHNLLRIAFNFYLQVSWLI